MGIKRCCPMCEEWRARSCLTSSNTFLQMRRRETLENPKVAPQKDIWEWARTRASSKENVPPGGKPLCERPKPDSKSQREACGSVPRIPCVLHVWIWWTPTLQVDCQVSDRKLRQETMSPLNGWERVLACLAAFSGGNVAIACHSALR